MRREATVTLLGWIATTNVAHADVRVGVDAVFPYGQRAAAAGGTITSKTLGVGGETALEAGVATGAGRFAFGLGYHHVDNGTLDASSPEGDVRNFAVSPRMALARARFDVGSWFLAARWLAGTAKARVVQDAVGFDYALSNGRGWGVGAGLAVPLGGRWFLRVPIGYDALVFEKGELTRVKVDSPPHTGPWTWRGAHVGLGLEAAFWGK
jgi:hypothetical protein